MEHTALDRLITPIALKKYAVDNLSITLTSMRLDETVVPIEKSFKIVHRLEQNPIGRVGG